MLKKTEHRKDSRGPTRAMPCFLVLCLCPISICACFSTLYNYEYEPTRPSLFFSLVQNRSCIHPAHGADYMHLQLVEMLLEFLVPKHCCRFIKQSHVLKSHLSRQWRGAADMVLFVFHRFLGTLRGLALPPSTQNVVVRNLRRCRAGGNRNWQRQSLNQLSVYHTSRQWPIHAGFISVTNHKM